MSSGIPFNASHHAPLMRVFVFDWILDGYDMLGVPPIDHIHQRRNRGRLAGSGRTADKHQNRKATASKPRCRTEARARRDRDHFHLGSAGWLTSPQVELCGALVGFPKRSARSPIDRAGVSHPCDSSVDSISPTLRFSRGGSRAQRPPTAANACYAVRCIHGSGSTRFSGCWLRALSHNPWSSC